MGKTENKQTLVTYSARDVILYGQNFLNCIEISWKNVHSYAFVQGRIFWKQEISSKISWNQ